MPHFPNCAYISTKTPEVGMGATEVWHSDRHACTVTRISKSGKTFWMKRDTATRTDSNGMSESQSYSYTPNPEAPEIRVNMTKDGWRTTGGQKVWVGVRDEHYDFSY